MNKKKKFYVFASLIFILLCIVEFFILLHVQNKTIRIQNIELGRDKTVEYKKLFVDTYFDPENCETQQNKNESPYSIFCKRLIGGNKTFYYGTLSRESMTREIIGQMSYDLVGPKNIKSQFVCEAEQNKKYYTRRIQQIISHCRIQTDDRAYYYSLIIFSGGILVDKYNFVLVSYMNNDFKDTLLNALHH